MKRENKNEMFGLITVDDARALKVALERNRLTQKWLMHRLDRDFGIKIRKSQLSEIMDGKRPIGPKMQRLIWCSARVIDEYESFYKNRG